MSETNPFGGEAGGFDMNALLQQAQAMQQQVMAAQRELTEREFDGTVGDGLVTVTINGAGELLKVGIRTNSFDPADTEDLEDLVVAAYRDARAQSDAMAAEVLGPLTEGMGPQGGDAGSGAPLGF